MTARAPFTHLCQTARPTLQIGRADLHLHTTSSDGLYTPAQVVDLARRTGLAAIAITDHDTMAGVSGALEAAAGRIEIVPGVEISCTWMGREVHLLAYFVRVDDPALNASLSRMRSARVRRYDVMVEKLRTMGVKVAETPPTAPDAALGRRNLAEQLAKSGAVDSIRDAFNRYLDDDKPAFAPKELLDLGEAIELVNRAGGVSSYAHPGNELDAHRLAQLAELGLGAVEVEYPTMKASRKLQLRQWAADLGLATTGGSDCHGPDDPKRAVGACTINSDEFNSLKKRTSRPAKKNGSISDGRQSMAAI